MKDEIQAAMIAHGAWKAKLESAIESGKSESSVYIVKTDNNCVFGKWFYSLTDTEKSSPLYSEIRELHANFHKAAAKVLEAAIGGKKDEAKKLMDIGGEYAASSSKLVLALGRWARSVN